MTVTDDKCSDTEKWPLFEETLEPMTASFGGGPDTRAEFKFSGTADRPTHQALWAAEGVLWTSPQVIREAQAAALPLVAEPGLVSLACAVTRSSTQRLGPWFEPEPFVVVAETRLVRTVSLVSSFFCKDPVSALSPSLWCRGSVQQRPRLIIIIRKTPKGPPKKAPRLITPFGKDDLVFSR